MGFFKFLQQDKQGNLVDFMINLKANELRVKDLAIEKAVNMIADVISKQEIKVYNKDSKGKIVAVKDDDYYTLNIRPNPNQDGTTFWRRVIKKLLMEQEILVVRSGEYMYLADTFVKSDDVTKPKKFTSVSVDSLTFKKSFSMDDSVYLNIEDSKIKTLLDGFFVDYGKLLKYAMSDYQLKNSTKYTLKIPALLKANMGADENGKPIMKDMTGSEYAKRISEELFSESGGIIPLGENISLEKIMGGEVKTSQDIRDLIGQAFSTVALAFNIPLDIFNGSKTDKSTSMNDMLTFAVDPIIEVLDDGLNSAWVSKEEYAEGKCYRVSKTNIKHQDIIDIASSLDKLTGIGFSRNEINELIGEPRIDETWADEHHITLNYTSSDKNSSDDGKKGGK